MQTRSKLRLLQQAVVQIPIQESYIIRISPIGETTVGEKEYWRRYIIRLVETLHDYKDQHFRIRFNVNLKNFSFFFLNFFSFFK